MTATMSETVLRARVRAFVERPLFSAPPGMGAMVAVLLLVFYVAAVMATKLHGGAFPQWFGSIGESMYTLFQIMTLESWSMGIVRPVMSEYPLSWLFFVPFVVITSYAVLNLFIALIVNSMQTLHEQDRQVAVHAEIVAHDERGELLREIRSLRREVHALAERQVAGNINPTRAADHPSDGPESRDNNNTVE